MGLTKRDLPFKFMLLINQFIILVLSGFTIQDSTGEISGEWGSEMDTLGSNIGLSDISDMEKFLPEDMLAGQMEQGTGGENSGQIEDTQTPEIPEDNPELIGTNITDLLAPEQKKDRQAEEAHREKLEQLRKREAERMARTPAELHAAAQRNIKRQMRAGKVGYKFDMRNLKVEAVLRSNRKHLTQIKIPKKVMRHFDNVKESFARLHSKIENFQKTMLDGIFKRWLNKAFVKRLFQLKLKEDKQRSYERYRMLKHKIIVERQKHEHKLYLLKQKGQKREKRIANLRYRASYLLSQQARAERSIVERKRQKILLEKREKELRIKKRFKGWVIRRLQELGVPADLEMVSSPKFNKKLVYWKTQYKNWIEVLAKKDLKRERALKAKLKKKNIKLEDKSLIKLLVRDGGQVGQKTNQEPVGTLAVKISAKAEVGSRDSGL